MSSALRDIQKYSCGDFAFEVRLDCDIDEEIELEWDFYVPLSHTDDLENLNIEDLIKSNESYKYEFKDRIETGISGVCLALEAKDHQRFNISDVHEQFIQPPPYDEALKRTQSIECPPRCANSDQIHHRNTMATSTQDATLSIPLSRTVSNPNSSKDSYQLQQDGATRSASNSSFFSLCDYKDEEGEKKRLFHNVNVTSTVLPGDVTKYYKLTFTRADQTSKT